ncbi:hypothetical protein B0H15DRAFT_442459 [Mycena belliarum]|uniref:Uncharacterized protein n=1 Tax=Mycena belliarum TaxID=1033014 RepID=A0AAD6XR65_9AGAR|nr:hypothetical protein B0H15DRAFT_442459 [Mycena belliae]
MVRVSPMLLLLRPTRPGSALPLQPRVIIDAVSQLLTNPITTTGAAEAASSHCADCVSGNGALSAAGAGDVLPAVSKLLFNDAPTTTAPTLTTPSATTSAPAETTSPCADCVSVNGVLNAAGAGGVLPAVSSALFGGNTPSPSTTSTLTSTSTSTSTSIFTPSTSIFSPSISISSTTASSFTTTSTSAADPAPTTSQCTDCVSGNGVLSTAAAGALLPAVSDALFNSASSSPVLTSSPSTPSSTTGAPDASSSCTDCASGNGVLSAAGAGSVLPAASNIIFGGGDDSAPTAAPSSSPSSASAANSSDFPTTNVLADPTGVCSSTVVPISSRPPPARSSLPQACSLRLAPPADKLWLMRPPRSPPWMQGRLPVKLG